MFQMVIYGDGVRVINDDSLSEFATSPDIT
jgi:hypothetical protein